MATTPKLKAVLLGGSPAGNDDLVNVALLKVEATFGILDRDLATPPDNPVAGDAYLVATGGTGAWLGQSGKIAVRDAEFNWVFMPAFEGMSLRIADENVRVEYDGTKFSAVDGFITLVDGANIAWDVSKGANAQVTLAGNRTLDAPTNFVAGRIYTLTVIQDGTGTRLLTWDALVNWAGGTAPTLSVGAADIDVFQFVSDGTSWQGMTVGLNMA